MRKISLRVTGCYYPSRMHSHCTHADYTLICDTWCFQPVWTSRAVSPLPTAVLQSHLQPDVPRAAPDTSGSPRASSQFCCVLLYFPNMPSWRPREDCLLPLTIPTIFFLCIFGGPRPTPAPHGPYLRHAVCTTGPVFYLTNIVCPHRYSAVRVDGRPSWPR